MSRKRSINVTHRRQSCVKELDQSWKELGNCKGVDPRLFFPENHGSTKKAKALCAACIVREACLEYAITNGEDLGIWGGLSERQRRRIRKQRELAAKQTAS